jgi:hypothetical protein
MAQMAQLDQLNEMVALAWCRRFGLRVLARDYWNGAANGGDGVMIPLYIFGSPLVIPLIVFAPIVFWPSVTFVLGRAERKKFRNLFLFLMAVHYIGMWPYLIVLGDWDHLSELADRSPLSVTILVTSYLAGQVAIWLVFAATQRAVGLQPSGQRSGTLSTQTED